VSTLRRSAGVRYVGGLPNKKGARPMITAMTNDISRSAGFFGVLTDD
jgi:hypothetical protein